MVAYLSTQVIREMHTMTTITAVKPPLTTTAISPPKGRPSDFEFSKVGASVVWLTPDSVADVDVATVVARGPTRRLVTEVYVATGTTVTSPVVVIMVVWLTPDSVADVDVATVVARGPTRRLVTEVATGATVTSPVVVIMVENIKALTGVSIMIMELVVDSVAVLISVLGTTRSVVTGVVKTDTEGAGDVVGLKGDSG